MVCIWGYKFFVFVFVFFTSLNHFMGREGGCWKGSNTEILTGAKSTEWKMLCNIEKVPSVKPVGSEFESR